MTFDDACKLVTDASALRERWQESQLDQAIAKRANDQAAIEKAELVSKQVLNAYSDKCKEAKAAFVQLLEPHSLTTSQLAFALL